MKIISKIAYSRGVIHLLVPLVIIGLLVGAFFAFQYLNKSKSSQTSAIPEGKMYKVGVYTQSQKLVGGAWDGFKKGMEELGYVDGKNVTYDYKDADSILEKLQTYPKEFASGNYDMIYVVGITGGADMYKAMQESGKQTPVLFSVMDNPDKRGAIKSFKSPGTNVTGVADNVVEVTAKKLELIKKLNPQAKKIGLFTQGFMIPTIGELIVAEIENQAPRFGLSVVEFKTSSPAFAMSDDDFLKIWRKVIEPIKPGDIDAIIHIAGHQHLQDIEEPALAKRLKIASVGITQPEIESGMLFGYSPDLVAMGRQASGMANKILKGTKANDIPVEYGKKIQLIINLKTAKEIGTKIPAETLDVANIKIGN